VRGVRNTWLDPLRFSQTRRDEVATLAEYEALLSHLVQDLAPQTLAQACELAESASVIRGFGALRQAHAAPVRARWRAHFSGSPGRTPASSAPTPRRAP